MVMIVTQMAIITCTFTSGSILINMLIVIVIAII